MSWAVSPVGIDELEMLTVTEVRFGAETVTVFFPLTFPCVAVMVHEPCDIPFANPTVETVATDESEVVQLADLVRS